MVLFAIAWLVSPIILFPLLISRSNKNKKYNAFLMQLRGQGRISDIEFMNLTAAVQYSGQGSAAQTAPPPKTPAAMFAGPPRAPAESSFIGPPAPEWHKPRMTGGFAANTVLRPQPQTAPQTAFSPQRTAAPLFVGPPKAPAVSAFIGPPSPEWYNIYVNGGFAAKSQQKTVRTVTPVPKGTSSVPDFPPRPQQNTAAFSQTPAASYQPNYSGNAYQGNTAAASYIPQKPKKERNPASVLMGIGAALVVLAGMVLSNAAWLTMGDWGRVGVIALMSLFFFGCSAVSHKKLNLTNTSVAFYLLGSVFVGITFVTMGYFGLLGTWLSVSGNGFWLLYSLATLLITLFMSLAAKVYKKGGFVHAALYSGLVSFTLMSVQVIDDKRWWAFALNLIAAVPIFLLHKESLSFGKQKGDPLRIFTAVTATVYALTALPYMLNDIAGEWVLPELLTAFVWFGQLMYYGSVRGSEKLKAAHAFARIVITAELSCFFVTGSADVKLTGSFVENRGNSRVMLFALIMFVLAAAWRFIPKLRSKLSDWLDAASLFIALLAYRVHWSNASTYVYDLLIALMLTAVTAFNALDKKESGSVKAFSGLFSLNSAISALCASQLVYRLLDISGTDADRMIAATLPMMLLSFVLAFVFLNIEKIRTAFSDMLYPLILFVCGGCNVYTGGQKCLTLAACSFMLMGALMIMTSNSGRTSAAKVMKYLLILPFTSLSYAAAMIPDLPGMENEWNLLLMAVILFAFAMFFRFMQLAGADIRTIVSDLGLTGIIFFIGISLLTASEPTLAAPAFLLSAVSALTFIFEKKPQRRGHILVMRCFFPVSLMFTFGSLIADSELVFSPKTETGLILYTAFALTIIMLGFDRVHRLRTGFSDFLLPVMSFGFIFFVTADLGSVDTGAELFAGLLASFVIPAMLTWQGCEKDEGKHLIIHRIAAPFTLAYSVTILEYMFRKLPEHTFAEANGMLIVTMIILAGAALFTYFGEKPGSFKGYAQSKYVWSIAAGLFLQPAVSMPVLQLALAVSLYLLCQRHANTLVSGFGVLAMYISFSTLAGQIADNSTMNYDTVYLILTCCAAVLLCCGRLLYRDHVHPEGEKGTVKLDTAALGLFAAPFIALSCQVGENMTASRSAALILAAAFFGNLIRKGHPVKFNRVMLSISSALLCCLVYTRQFLISDDPAVNAKINLIPLVAYGVIVRYIWRENEKLSSNFSFGVHVSALGFLMLDALMNQSLANTLFVLITTLVILLISFAKKNGRWFAVSGASFLGLTLYITQSFFGRAEWWVYLLAAGIILIVVASVNEYLKSNGTSIKVEAERFKDRWKK